MRKGVSRIISVEDAGRNQALANKIVADWKKSVYGKSISADCMKILADIAVSRMTR